MTFTALQNAALKRFAEEGFSGTSLAQIAADVGIKPPSIYAHFLRKVALFLSQIEPTVMAYLAYVRQALLVPDIGEEVLASFLINIEKRFETLPVMRFLLHTAYLPPQQLRPKLDKPVKQYMKNLDAIMIEVFKLMPPGQIEPDILAAAYMGVIDSLQAEILYGGKKRFRKRQEALWALFRLALQKKGT